MALIQRPGDVPRNVADDEPQNFAGDPIRHLAHPLGDQGVDHIGGVARCVERSKIHDVPGQRHRLPHYVAGLEIGQEPTLPATTMPRSSDSSPQTLGPM